MSDFLWKNESSLAIMNTALLTDHYCYRNKDSI